MQVSHETAQAIEAASRNPNARTWIFTFGAGHPFANCYIGIIAPDSDKARWAMNYIFGQRWGFQYEAGDPIHGLSNQQEAHGIQPLLHLNVVARPHSDQPEIILIPQHEFAYAVCMERKL